MSDAGEVKIDQKSLAKLRKVPAIFQSKELDRGLKKVLLVVEREGKKLVRVDTGRLRASITTSKITRGPREISGETGTFGDVVGVMGKRKVSFRLGGGTGTGVFYGPFVEYGTKYMTARPFLGPALDIATAQAGPIINEAITKAWNRIVR